MQKPPYTGVDLDPRNYNIENISIKDNEFIGGSVTGIRSRHEESGTWNKHIDISGNKFHDGTSGMGINNMSYVTIKGNKFHTLSGNGITLYADLGTVDHVYMEGNEFFAVTGEDIDERDGQIPTSISSRQNLDTFLHVKAASVDYVHAVISGIGAPRTVTGALTNPDVPRTLTFTLSNVAAPTGDIEVIGVDARGYPLDISKTLSAGATVETSEAFATISQFIIPAGVTAADNVKVGIGDKLGLSNWIWATTDVYKASGGGIALPEMSAVAVYRSSTQNIAQATATTVEYDTELYDSLGEFDSTTDHDFTATYAGKYLVCATVGWAVAADQDQREIRILVNGTNIRETVHTSADTHSESSHVSAAVDLAASDVLKIQVYLITNADAIWAGQAVSFLTINRLLTDEAIVSSIADMTIPTVSATYMTIDMATITEGDSYSVWYRTSLNYHD